MKTPVLLSVLLFVWASGITAQSNTKPDASFSGRVYSDYYWIAQHHNQDLEGNHGFWLRRVYFTYDQQISNSISTRFRLQGSSPGDFITDTKITPVVKDLYLRWKKGQHQVEAGISSTPTFSLVEDVWGYRSIEKSPLDLLDFASSRDFGISLEGTLDQDERLNYHFMFGNGNSNSSEINRGKKIMLSLGYELTDHIVLEAYGDYNAISENSEWYTLQGFAGYRSDMVTLGLLYAHQVRQSVQSSTNRKLDVLSIFSNFPLSDTVQGFLRLDRTFDPIPGLQNNDYLPISNRAAATIIIGGLDIDLGHDIHLMPNVEAVSYKEQEQGVSPATDLIPRLTLFYNF